MRVQSKMFAIVAAGALLAGCADMSDQQQRMLSGAAIGAAGGTAIGAIAGGSSGALWGAAIGTAIGTGGGYLFDRDRQQRSQ